MSATGGRTGALRGPEVIAIRAAARRCNLSRYHEIMELQVLISKWLTQIATYLPFGYSFGAGMVSAVNPCGFAMLPVYLTLYLGAEDSTFYAQSALLRILKALWITAVVTAGFGLLFGITGAVITLGGTFLHRMIPWLSLLVGIVLIVLGVWTLMGHYVSLPSLLRFSERFGDPRRMRVRDFFIFGMAFGATSMSCTLPIFLLVMGSSIASGDLIVGLLQFVSYISGMGSVMLVLTLGIAVVKQGVVVGTLRRILPHVQKISAVLLFVAGAYIVYYWTTSELL